jgi:hypothetical protein
MIGSVFDRERFGDHYLSARSKVDELCAAVVNAAVTYDRAQETYGKIEAEFAGHEPERAELFHMIYKNRVERLCRQFLSESDHGA